LYGTEDNVQNFVAGLYSELDQLLQENLRAHFTSVEEALRRHREEIQHEIITAQTATLAVVGHWIRPQTETQSAEERETTAVRALVRLGQNTPGQGLL